MSGRDFWSWRGTMYHAAAHLEPEEVYDVARMAFLEMLLSGTTTVGSSTICTMLPAAVHMTIPTCSANRSSRLPSR